MRGCGAGPILAVHCANMSDAIPRPVVVVPAELEYFSHLPAMLGAAGCTVRQAGDPATLASTILDADVVLASVFLSVDRASLAEARQLRGVVSLVIGVDTIDVGACTEMGLIVANGAVPENPIGMAEATVLLVAALVKGLKSKEIALRSGVFRPPGNPSNLVWRKTVGIVGVGRIGRMVAERLQGWDVNLLGYSPHLTVETAPPGMRVVGLPELLRESDVVSIHAPLSAETRGLIGSRELALMKPTGYLVNTARGGIVDELALADALREGRLAGAAIDVWPDEPPPLEHPLFGLPPGRVILTGHCIGHAAEQVPALAEAAAENVTRVARGEVPRYVVNPEVIPAWRERIALLDRERQTSPYP
jgi:phosphoglycerate dehydrogenase-like enzyme